MVLHTLGSSTHWRMNWWRVAVVQSWVRSHVSSMAVTCFVELRRARLTYDIKKILFMPSTINIVYGRLSKCSDVWTADTRSTYVVCREHLPVDCGTICTCNTLVRTILVTHLTYCTGPLHGCMRWQYRSTYTQTAAAKTTSTKHGIVYYWCARLLLSLL